MATSEARIAANRQNAQLSTGPRTVEGKEKSRANSLKHGLCATVLVTEDIDSIRRRADAWYFALKPQNPHQAWQVDQVAVISLRIDRSERMERRYRDRAMLRAEIAWDDDRMIEIEHLGAKIRRRPSEIVRQLRATPHGCDWLIERWGILAVAADKNTVWTADQTQLAFDLLGTVAEARDGHQPGDLLDLDFKTIEPSPGPADVARREIASLRERRDRVADLDEVDRALVCADQFDETNHELKKLRRYENTLHNRLRWFVKELRDPSPHKTSNPDHRPRWVERLEPTTSAEAPVIETAPVNLQPPFDLTPEEIPPIGQNPDIAKISANRHAQKIKKAETRRDNRRRNVERLRA